MHDSCRCISDFLFDILTEGDSFLSCSFDRHVRLWDTETGQCKGTYSNRKVPYCCKFYPKVK